MKIALCAKDWRDVVAHRMPQHPDADQQRKNQCAMNLVWSSVDEDSLEEIQDHDTAHEMWERLKIFRGTCDDYHAKDALTEFATAPIKPNETILEY